MTDNPNIIDGVDISECDCFIEKMDFPNHHEGGYYNQNNLRGGGVHGVESYPFFVAKITLTDTINNSWELNRN